MNILKGWIGEKVTQLAMWAHLDDRIYRRYHDIILETNNGTTQIDHIIVSMYGIFVIETKNYAGWIFGDERQSQWTQVLYGKKTTFQNPLHQNYKHTKELSRVLDISHEKVHSIVLFIGESQFKTKMPPNVLDKGLAGYIKSFTKALFDAGMLDLIEEKIRQLKESPALSRRDHVEKLIERFNSDTICPKCGSQLVRRTARQGQSAGQSFLGCSGFPRCRYKRPDRNL